MNYNSLFMKLSSESKGFLEKMTLKTQMPPEVLAIAVARVLSTIAVLPSSEVEDPVCFYRNTNKLKLNEDLAQLNEMIVLDTVRVQKLTEDFYMARYYAAYPLKAIYSFKQELAVPSFFGFGAFVSVEVLESISKYSLELSSIYTNVLRICREIELIRQASTEHASGLAGYVAQ